MSCPSFLSAQIDFRPGYIVKKGGDTVKGFVAYRMDKKNMEGCSFRESHKGLVTDYIITDIDAFGIFGDKVYQSATLPRGAPTQGRVFIKVVVKGAVSLYKYKDFFLVKGKDSLTSLPIPKNRLYGAPGEQKLKMDKRYIGVLMYTMQDCKTNASKVAYAEGPLSQLVYDYNLCAKKGPTARSLRPMYNVGLTVFTGYVNSNLRYDFNYVIPFKGNTVIGGVGIDLSSPRVFDKLLFSIEAWYSKSFYQGYYSGFLAGDPIKQDVFAEFTSLKIPFGIKYNFKSAGNTPYLKAGFFWSSTQRSSVRTVEERETSTGILTDEFTTGYQVKNPKGYWASIGYDKTIYKGMCIFTEFRYEIGEGYIGFPGVNASTMSSFNFLTGLRF